MFISKNDTSFMVELDSIGM